MALVNSQQSSVINDIMSDRLTAIDLVRSADARTLSLRTAGRTTNRFCFGNQTETI
ncbi:MULTISPECIES: hypothetical protein [unclassified Microcoleus]|uniref:hypothetical protein n=1 Tax=unclassified Microcoleus TaxID=2642155 RepID=UPI002FCF597D